MAETLATLPALAKSIATHFPDLQGRSIAVSEVEPFTDKTNVPTLPIAVTALVREEGDQNQWGAHVKLVDDILVQFIFTPVKYERDDKADTPFFAFYDYEAIRDKMLQLTKYWVSPRGTGLFYKQMDVESDEFAVYVAFRFRMEESWDDESEMAVPPETRADFRLFEPTGECCVPDQCAPDATDDPCYPARLRNPYGAEAKAVTP